MTVAGAGAEAAIRDWTLHGCLTRHSSGPYRKFLIIQCFICKVSLLFSALNAKFPVNVVLYMQIMSLRALFATAQAVGCGPSRGRRGCGAGTHRRAASELLRCAHDGQSQAPLVYWSCINPCASPNTEIHPRFYVLAWFTRSHWGKLKFGHPESLRQGPPAAVFSRFINENPLWAKFGNFSKKHGEIPPSSVKLRHPPAKKVSRAD